MRNHSTPIFIALLLGSMISACKPAERNTPLKPNVLVILTDDQGWGDLSVQGNTNLSTPNVDRLAAEGARLQQFFVAPVCSPTRAEFLTGRYSQRLGVTFIDHGEERMNLGEITIADIFREAGYATGAFGKWHNGSEYPYHPTGRGFDQFYGMIEGSWANYFSPLLDSCGKVVRGEGFIADDFTNKAMDFIEKNKNQPFFCYLPYNTPHTPLQVPDEYWNRFKDKELKMRHHYIEEKDDYTRAVLAMCENIDWNVGRIMQKLEDLGLKENTIVVYFSDNGPDFYRWIDGLRDKKASTNEGGVRVPMFMRWPGHIEAGKSIPQISTVIDLLPTLADLAGLSASVPDSVDGISLVPLLTGNPSNWEERIIINAWRNQVSVRSQRFRLDHKGDLFDMVNDRGQDTIVNDRHPMVYKELSGAADRFRADVMTIETPYRPHTIGHPGTRYNNLPVGIALIEGGIERSNRWTNCSYLQHWTSTEDRITYDVEVQGTGTFEAALYYTCPPEDVGSLIRLSLNGKAVEARVTHGHNPPLTGMENDRVPRTESYEKEWAVLEMGTIDLEPGTGTLTLQALEIPGDEVLDLHLLTLTRQTE
ncbi:MAG: arylsulfatase [Bacteroidales bacterium]